MDNMRQWDPHTAADIQLAFNHWDDIELQFKGETIRPGAPGGTRKKPLNILQARCEQLGEAGPDHVFRSRLPRRRPDHCQRRHQLPHPHPVRVGLQARHRGAAQPLHLAGHPQAVRRLHLPSRRKPSTAGSRPTSTSSTRTPPRSSSNARNMSGRRMGWTRPTPRHRSHSVKRSLPTTCRAPN